MIDLRASLPVAGCLLFGAIVFAELSGGTSERNAASATVPARAGHAPVAASSAPPARPTPPNELVATSLARPLFSQTRQPPEAQGGAGPGELADKRLAGIVIAADRRLAIFAVAGAKPLALAEGDTVDGWRIESITASDISLHGPGGSRTLEPRIDPNAVREARFPPPARPGAQPVRPPPTAAAPARGFQPHPMPAAPPRGVPPHPTAAAPPRGPGAHR